MVTMAHQYGMHIAQARQHGVDLSGIGHDRAKCDPTKGQMRKVGIGEDGQAIPVQLKATHTKETCSERIRSMWGGA